jgi:glycosyltransferase involved in cell wall biosynthesis
MERKLRDAGRVAAAKLLYIPNGVDLDRFARSPDPGWRARCVPGAGRLAVMLGRISRQKSPHLLALALGRLRERGALPAGARMSIVGEAECPKTRKQLDDAIHQHRLGDVVTLSPPTTEPEVYYHAADFTVLASLWEGMPNVVLESLAAGRPALVSAAANAAGLIEDGVTGWVVPTGEVEPLAERLGQVFAAPPATLERMRAACQQRASDFDVSRMVQRYEALYAALLDPSAAPSSATRPFARISNSSERGL